MKLADVVNFNADASCLSAETWLDTLRGEVNSLLCRWLEGFVEQERRVTFGIVGATVSDMAMFNPESIALINSHPEIFEMILRPYAHDIGLLRSREAFVLNVELGRSVITSEFEQVTPYLLAPEFMLTNEQIRELTDRGVAGTFINPGRFETAVAKRIPKHPYRLTGLFDAELDCIPVAPALTEAYLDSLHQWECTAWNATVLRARDETLCSWRDGESWLFVPDGLAREHAWLAGESNEIERIFVRDLVADAKFEDPTYANPDACISYPVHSFSDWVGESRMLGFLQRLLDLERRLHTLTQEERLCWLQAANSDVLSAVEKASPHIRINTLPPGDPACKEIGWEIRRSERGFEGEEYLAIAERLSPSGEARRYLSESNRPHMAKLRARMDYFSSARLGALELP